MQRNNMMANFQIKDFIETNNISDTFIKSFRSLLEQNTCEDLDIRHKNISIETRNLDFELLNGDAIAFKSQIDQDGNIIGYYRLVFALDGTLIDDFFVIY
ncbi:hypothetical protein ASU31_10335 [Pedobacter ginsenosidimutans]|uniref:Uncharacterized protein n=1 Tax=Pedobacter ginsenosidimutans TaxID=687842 RepID=A0A0T5VRU6_9SPHI|nr:hypothetical protein [Pedobacter ginsenosidimutans]KRT16550.1 hypothetical protein ASU31_10335 [Pedobacter ginsenosidimutans]